MQDLSVHHRPVNSPFLATDQCFAAGYELCEEQIEFFHEYGYLKGVRILSDEQVEVLRRELAGLLDAQVEERDLFYEYNSNESGDPNHVLFHALGAWRIAPGFHDLLWHPAFTIPAAQLPTLLQACSSWRSSGLASGLFVLDANSTSRSSYLLDWP
jgi:hypothetical protein